MKGQSEEAKAERLKNGCCPVHGVPMSQITGWEKDWCFVGCPRRDCDIAAKAKDPNANYFEPRLGKKKIQEAHTVQFWAMLKDIDPPVYEQLVKRVNRRPKLFPEQDGRALLREVEVLSRRRAN